MSRSDDGGFNALKAPAFIVGIAALIVTILYVTKRCGPNLFGQETIPRNYLAGSNVPPDIRSDTGERPKMWDVSTTSWCSLCSQPGYWLEWLGWAEFLVSCPTFLLSQSLSVPFRFVRSSLPPWVSSHYLLTRCRTQILTFPHPKRRAVIPSDPHHRPKSKSVSSSLCQPFLILRLQLPLPHRTRSPTTFMIRQENMRLGRLTSRTPQTTNFLLLGS